MIRKYLFIPIVDGHIFQNIMCLAGVSGIVFCIAQSISERMQQKDEAWSSLYKMVKKRGDSMRAV